MVNRVGHLVGEELDAARQNEFYEICTFFCGTFVVTLETALYIERQLERVPQPEWIEFRDLFGARQRLGAQLVLRISESSATTRAAFRAFERARSREDESDSDPLGKIS